MRKDVISLLEAVRDRLEEKCKDCDCPGCKKGEHCEDCMKEDEEVNAVESIRAVRSRIEETNAITWTYKQLLKEPDYNKEGWVKRPKHVSLDDVKALVKAGKAKKHDRWGYMLLKLK